MTTKQLTPTAYGIHNGQRTHTQLHVMYPVSFNPINSISSNPAKLIPCFFAVRMFLVSLVWLLWRCVHGMHHQLICAPISISVKPTSSTTPTTATGSSNGANTNHQLQLITPASFNPTNNAVNSPRKRNPWDLCLVIIFLSP